MHPIPLPGLLGELRSKVRTNLENMVNELLENGECFNRYEALRLMQEELACLEAEERGKQLIVRGWGETLDFGLLQEGAENKLTPWAAKLMSMLRITSCKRIEEGTHFQQDLKMALAFQDDSAIRNNEERKDDTAGCLNTVVELTAHYSNRDLDDYDEDSLALTEDDHEEEIDDDDPNFGPMGDDDDDEDDEDAADYLLDGPPDAGGNRDPWTFDEMRQYMEMQNATWSAVGTNPQHHTQRDRDPAVHDDVEDDEGDEDDSEDDDESEEEEDDEDLEDDEDDEDEEDDEDDEEEEDHDGPKTRVDYLLKTSHPANADKGVSKTVAKISFTTCSRHSWDPEFYENEDKKDIHSMDAPDFYNVFEQTGTGGAYGVATKREEFHEVQESMLMWAAEARPPRISAKKKKESFVVYEQCECVTCNVRHGFRVEVHWETLYKLMRILEPAFDKSSLIVPEVLYRFEARIADPRDELFAFVRATRILAFFMIYTAGSSGYAVSPVDFFFGSVIAEGIPIFSGMRMAEFFADYESDGSLGID